MLTGISRLAAKSRFRSPPLRVLFVGMGVTFVMCAGGTKVVRASCGDYLEHRVQKELESVHAAFPAENEDNIPYKPWPCFCKSSQCQEAPPPPLPVSPSINLVMDSHSGWCPEREPLAPASHYLAFLKFSVSAVSDGYPLRIEHPPRV